MQINELVNPNTGVATKLIEFVNKEASTAMAHGDVIVSDTAGLATLSAASGVLGEHAKLSSSANQVGILGVVYDPGAIGVPAGGRGLAMVRGIHPAVKVEVALGDGSTDLSIGEQIASSATAGKCGPATAAPGKVIGYSLIVWDDEAADGTIPAYIDVK